MEEKVFLKPVLLTLFNMRGEYGPHTEELLDNSELAYAGGPSFGDF
jgi:hypothetical protein